MTKTEREENLQAINDNFEIANDARQPYIEKASKSYKQYKGILTQKTDARGYKLSDININKTAETVDAFARDVTRILLRDRDKLALVPQSPEDNEDRDTIESYTFQKMKRVPAVNESLRKVILQIALNGLGPGRWRYDKYLKQWFFDWVMFQNWWGDPAPSIGSMRYIMERITMTENQLKGNKNYQNVDKYIKGLEDPKTEDARAELLSNAKVELPEKYGKGNYDILLSWELTDKNKWGVTTYGTKASGDGKFEAIEILEEQKFPYWFGNPYCLGVAEFDPISIYPDSEAVKVRPYQKTLNIVYQQIVDYGDRLLHPQTIYNPLMFESSEDEDNLMNPELNNMVRVKEMDMIKQLPLNPMPSSAYSIVRDMDARIEQRSGQDTLAGQQPSHREPAYTTKRRIELASGITEDKIWTIGVGFYKPMMEKFFVGLQQYWDEDNFIRITGQRGMKFLRKGEIRKTYSLPMISKGYFSFEASREEVVKHFDLEIIPAYEAESKEMIKQNAVQIVQYFTLLSQIAPHLLKRMDLEDVTKQYIKACGILHTENVFTALDKLPPQLLDLLTQAFYNNPEAFVMALQRGGIIPSEDAEQQGGKGMPNLAQPSQGAYQRPPGIGAASDSFRQQSQGV